MEKKVTIIRCSCDAIVTLAVWEETHKFSSKHYRGLADKVDAGEYPNPNGYEILHPFLKLKPIKKGEEKKISKRLRRPKSH